MDNEGNDTKTALAAKAKRASKNLLRTLIYSGQYGTHLELAVLLEHNGFTKFNVSIGGWAARVCVESITGEKLSIPLATLLRHKDRAKRVRAWQVSIEDETVCVDSDYEVVDSPHHLVSLCVGQIRSMRDRDVILARLGFLGVGITLSKLGEELNLTRERVRQLEERAIKSIKLSCHRFLRDENIKGIVENLTAESIARCVRADFFYSYPLTAIKVLACFIDEKKWNYSSIVSASVAAYRKILLEEKIEASHRYKEGVIGSPLNGGDYVFDVRRVGDWAWFPSSFAVCRDRPKRRIRTPDINSQSEFKKGKFWSRKNCRTIYYESGIEMKFLSGLEASLDVEWYLEQPFKIEYVDERGDVRFYIPDVIVGVKNFGAIVIELKPVWQMVFSGNIRKFAALKKFCVENGYGFSVTNGEVSVKELVSNVSERDVKFVSKFIKVGCSFWSAIRIMKLRSIYSESQMIGVLLYLRIWVTGEMKFASHDI